MFELLIDVKLELIKDHVFRIVASKAGPHFVFDFAETISAVFIPFSFETPWKVVQKFEAEGEGPLSRREKLSIIGIKRKLVTIELILISMLSNLSFHVVI